MARKPCETLVKTMVLKVFVCLLIALFILPACTSGPVPVRDITTSPNTDVLAPTTRDQPAVQSNQPLIPAPDKLEIAPSIIEPSPAPVPLNHKLKQQAEQSLQQQHWQQAILFAERGLRINRKEPFFYWVLSAAYQQLSEIQKSIDFARQGLRYIADDIGLKSRLMSLSSQ